MGRNRLWDGQPTLPYHPQNRPFKLVAETRPSFDDLRQHASIDVRKVGQYLDQILLVGQIADWQLKKHFLS